MNEKKLKTKRVIALAKEVSDILSSRVWGLDSGLLVSLNEKKKEIIRLLDSVDSSTMEQLINRNQRKPYNRVIRHICIGGIGWDIENTVK